MSDEPRAGDGLTHVDSRGEARMVDVAQKAVTERVAVAEGCVRMQTATLEAIQQNALAKGDVLSVARLAGIMGAKQTSALIPLCHPLGLDQVDVELHIGEEPPRVEIRATARCHGRTGVEMEALTAVTVSALTIYDMAKAMDRSMEIDAVRLVEKRGGRSGHWKRSEDPPGRA